ncbi:MAG: hypothetical protein K5930_06975 [Treponemataceae bacterium]|nr:hypothetical protein [Treponemataceae bacterium]
MGKIVTLCLSAGIQKTIRFDNFTQGEVNRSKSYRYDASGKAINSARVLTQLLQLAPGPDDGSKQKEEASTENYDVSVVCPLGERNMDFFLQMAESDGLCVRPVAIPGFTRECCTLIDEAKGQTTELVVEEPVPVEDSAAYEERLMEVLKKELGLSGDGLSKGAEKADALLFSGSRPKFWKPGLIKRIATLAKEKGILFMADFRGDDLLSILDQGCPDIIKINEDEFWATFSKVEGGEKGEEALLNAIAERSRNLGNIIVVTSGSKETLAAAYGNKFKMQSELIKAVNTIGCGDAYNAGFLYEYLATKDMSKSLEKGKWCASRNAECLRPGVLHD